MTVYQINQKILIMRKTILFLLVLYLFSLSFCSIFYYTVDNFVGIALLLGAPLLHSSYLFGALRKKEPSKIILFLVSLLSMLFMTISFIGSGWGTNTFYPMLLISLFVLSLCFSSGFLSFGDSKNLFTVLIGDTLGFGIIIFGTLLNLSRYWELHIFVLLFYMAIILGFLASKLLRNKLITS